MDTQHLIQYLVWFATTHDVQLSTNRLVKFLYLADVAQARRFEGQTLTGFPWSFVNYGPYCREVMNSIDEAVHAGLISKLAYDSKFGDDKEYYIYKCDDDRAENNVSQLHIAVSTFLESAIRKFGSDTPALLDYVYFDTEPMQNVKKKFDFLDFSACKPLPNSNTVKAKQLSKSQVKKCRDLLACIVEDRKRNTDTLAQDELASLKWKDDKYYEAIEAMDGDDLEPGLSGIAKIVT